MTVNTNLSFSSVLSKSKVHVKSKWCLWIQPLVFLYFIIYLFITDRFTNLHCLIEISVLFCFTIYGTVSNIRRPLSIIICRYSNEYAHLLEFVTPCGHKSGRYRCESISVVLSLGWLHSTARNVCNVSWEKWISLPLNTVSRTKTTNKKF